MTDSLAVAIVPWSGGQYKNKQHCGAMHTRFCGMARQVRGASNVDTPINFYNEPGSEQQQVRPYRPYTWFDNKVQMQFVLNL